MGGLIFERHRVGVRQVTLLEIHMPLELLGQVALPPLHSRQSYEHFLTLE